MKNLIVVFLKAPEAGKVKTRLCPPLSHNQAARFYKALARDTWETAKSVSDAQVVAAYEPGESRGALDWLTPESPAPYFLQEGRDLGERLARAFEKVFQGGAKKVIIIGSDAPLLSRKIMEQALSDLDRVELVLGPAKDGGYYLIGLKKPVPELFRDIPWSTNRVLKETISRAKALELKTAELAKLSDIDVFADVLNLIQEFKSQSPGVCPNVRRGLESIRVG